MTNTHRITMWHARARETAQIVLLHFCLTILTIIFIGPFVYLVGTSLKETMVLLTYPPVIIPRDPTLANYIHIFTQTQFPRWILNSTIVSVVTTLGTLIVCSLAAYVFARKEFIGKDLVYTLILSTLMIPSSLLLIPSFLVIARLGLVDTYPGLILPSLGGPIGVFMLRQFIQTISVELDQAAKIDGCSDFGIYWRIILPLTKPALATLATVTATWSWNALIWPLVVVRSKEMVTLPLGIAMFQAYYQTNWGLLTAGGFLSVAPLIIIFLFFQRYFIQGLTAGGLKG
jgi:multiple sugar transport system permease protein